MKRHLILIGSYIVLIVGIFLGIILFLGSVLVFVRYPEGNFQKKVMVAIGLVTAGIIVILTSISLFEFMHEVVRLEHEIREIEAETDLHIQRRKSTE